MVSKCLSVIQKGVIQDEIAYWLIAYCRTLPTTRTDIDPGMSCSLKHMFFKW